MCSSSSESERLDENGGHEMLAMWTANLKEGKDKEYKEWVLRNLKLYKKNLPPGWTLRGVYGGSLGPPDICWIWEFKKYADIDRAREFKNAVFDRVSAEETTFLLPGTARITLFTEVEKWLVQAPRKPKKK